MAPSTHSHNGFRTGWSAALSKLALVALAFEAITGLAITLAPFHATVEWSVLVHTLVGLATLVPLTWYFWVHWVDYKRFKLSDVVLLGYVAVAALLVTSVSGLVVTWQGLFGLRMAPLWRNVHLVSTLVALAAAIPHVVLVYVRVRAKEETATPARRTLFETLAATAVGLVIIAALALLYSGPHYVNAFPDDYQLRLRHRTGRSPRASPRPPPAAPSTPRRSPARSRAAPPAATSRSSRSGSPAPTATPPWTRFSRGSRT